MWCGLSCRPETDCGTACSECRSRSSQLAEAVRKGDVGSVLSSFRTIIPQHGLAGPCVVEYTVHKVVLHRRRDAPMLGWLTGHRDLLYVELAASDTEKEPKRTSTGFPEEREAEARAYVTGEVVRPIPSTEEAWVWGHPAKTKTGSFKHAGEKIVFNAQTKTQFTLRVLGSHTDWREVAAPLSTLGEARFTVDEDVLPAVVLDGALSLPLVQDSRVRGIVSLTAQFRGGEVGRFDAASPGSKVGRWVQQNRLVRLKGHSHAVTCCSLFPYGGRLLTVSLDKTGIVWSSAGEVLARLQGHTGPVNHCAVFPSGEKLLTVSEDETAIIWSSSGQKLVMFSGVRFCVIFHAGDRVLAGGGHNGCIFSSIGEQLAALRGHSDNIVSGAVFPKDQLVITVSRDEEAIIWTRDGDIVKHFRGHHDVINACAVFPSGDQVLTVSQDRTGIIWSSSGHVRNMGKQLAVLRGHTDSVTACAVFPSGDRVMTVSDDERGMIWSVSGERLAELRGHSGPIAACAIFSNGQLVLTVSRDKTGIVWTGDGIQLAELYGHTDAIRTCEVFPSGEYVLTVSDDCSGIIWPLSLYLPPGHSYK